MKDYLSVIVTACVFTTSLVQCKASVNNNHCNNVCKSNNNPATPFGCNPEGGGPGKPAWCSSNGDGGCRYHAPVLGRGTWCCFANCDTTIGTQSAATTATTAATNTASVTETEPSTATGFVGVNFALNLQVNPLPKATAAGIVARAGFKRAKIFSHNTDYLNALKHAGMRHLVVSIPNHELAGYDATAANALVRKLIAFTDAGITFDVVVGNEPLASWYGGRYRDLIVPAFDLVRAAIAANANADPTKIKVTVAFQLGIMGNSYPPSKGSFTSADGEIIRQVASREVATGSPFFVNIYPYFARAGNPRQISLDYALGNTGLSQGGEIVRDYDSLLDAQVGAVRAALLALDSSFSPEALPIVLGETGWPTAGVDSDDVSASHAEAYARNTIRYVQDKAHVSGAYLFEAFDEGLKSGDSGAGTDSTIENHWGIYLESGEAKYPVVLPPSSAPPTSTTEQARTPPEASCLGPYSSAFVECEDRIQWLMGNWDNPHYTEKGVDGSRCSIQNFLSTYEKWCPPVPTQRRRLRRRV